MSLEPGSRLGAYEILSPLGAGGMGEVYRARDPKLGRDVAVKVLPEGVARDAERLARFEREARALAALNHPGIVTIYSIEESDKTRFLAMELVEGQSLDAAMASEAFSLARFFEVAVALADALSAAHERGIVHRDLKPANVMITPEGRVKVLDFGLAKLEAAGSDPNVTGMPTASRVELTGEGQVFGTVAYMSPEQARGGRVDARSDVFSLGVVLYQLLTGERPFHGASAVDMMSSILRDTPRPVTDLRADVPPHLARILRRCLEKDPRDRYQTSRDVYNELKDLRAETSVISSASLPRSEARPAAHPASGEVRAEEGFWVAVLPFKHRAADPGVEALAEGITEEIVTGLSRFSYLHVISRGSTVRYAGETADVREVGRELGARYVLDGSLRQSGSALRVSVQLIDAVSGAHLWAETYNRPFRAEEIFALQDDLVPRIVSTIADMHGVLPRSMSEILRHREPETFGPYEAVLRSFGYYERLTAEEHAEVRDVLERAVRSAPDHADCLAMLSMMYSEEHKHGFNPKPDPLGRALEAARRAVVAAPSNHLAYHALAQALFFRRELPAFRNAADRAVALNPLDGDTTAFMGILMSYAGDWEHGCALAERATQFNPNHPGWYWFAAVNNALRKKDYRTALDIALKMNLPSYFYTHASLAVAWGHLGEKEAAGRAVRELLALKPDFASEARVELGKWMGEGELLEIYMDGLRRAGLEVPAGDSPALPEAEAEARVAIAVLPFSDLSPEKDHEYLCEGMAEEIMNALVAIPGIRVASRTSAFRARRQERGLAEIARALNVGHVLEGSVRTSGNRLRVTAQLTDAATGYQLWSERYDRSAGDVFAVQDEIAGGVVEAVRARLAPGARSVPARPQPVDLEAYRLYLKGRYLRYTLNDHGAALRAFREAIAIDPSHGPSWLGLAEVTILATVYGLVPVAEGHATARKALATALASRGESAESLYIEGMMAFGQRDYSAAERAFDRVIALQPDYTQARCWSGLLLSVLGRPAEAATHLQRAREADPLASYPYAMSALALLIQGRASESKLLSDQALAFEPDNTLALWATGLALAALGWTAEAVTALERATTPSHRGGLVHGMLGWALAKAGRTDEARAVLKELQARPASAPTVVSEAWTLAGLGDPDAAFRVLERAEAERQQALLLVGLPGFDALRPDPRFAALLSRLGLRSGPARTGPARDEQ